MGSAVERTFLELMEITNSVRKTPLSSVAYLDGYPFRDLPYPPNESLTYVGYGLCDDTEVSAYVRIVGWEIVNNCFGGKKKVSHLRRIVASPNTDDPTQRYSFFEIGVEGSIFMIGGQVYDPDSKWDCKHRLELLMDGLSGIFGLDVEVFQIDHKDAVLADSEINHKREKDAAERKKYEIKQRAIARRRAHFKKGDQVVWGAFAFHHRVSDPKPDRNVHEVLAVEIIPDYCSCGLTERASLHLHPLGRCHLRRRHEAMHHQILTIQLGGHKERLPGIYFTHLTDI